MKTLALIFLPIILLSSCASQAPVDGQPVYTTRSQMQMQDDIMAVHRENLRRTSRFF